MYFLQLHLPAMSSTTCYIMEFHYVILKREKKSKLLCCLKQKFPRPIDIYFKLFRGI